MRRRSVPTVLRGTVAVPGDKSISHRAVILGALARGPSVIRNVNDGADVRATADAMALLGARVAWGPNNEPRVEVEGSGWDGLREPPEVVDAGNSGTTLRCLLGVCAALPAWTVLTGDDSLRTRPMLRVVAPLRQMGARIDGRHHADRAPLAVRGGDLEGVDFATSVPSAQVKSAILFAGLAAQGRTSVTEPAPSRDHTERMLAAAGAPIERDGTSVAVSAWTPEPTDRNVPGDLSAAMFLIGAACICAGSELRVHEVGLNPTRSGAIDALRAMGASVEVEPAGESSGEPVGCVIARASDLRGITVDPSSIPSLIDEIPLLAVVATQADGATVIDGAGELRVKESDRIAATAAGLRALGADVEELPAGLVVRGPTPLSGGEVDSAGDHRLAMAFAVAGLLVDGKVTVRGWRSVETSFPGFADVLAQATRRR